MSENGIPLVDAIEDLRVQLQEASKNADGKSLRFKVEGMELEFKCTVSREDNVEAGVKYWLLNAQAGAKMKDEMVHTVKIKLGPPVDRDGNEIKLSDEQEGLS
ncbi:MAG: trypco2 family protein [Nitrospinota bacterium]